MTSEQRLQKFHADDPDLVSAPDWSSRERKLLRPIRTTTQIWVVNVISKKFLRAFAQTSFRWNTGGVVVKCGLFSQAINKTRE